MLLQNIGNFFKKNKKALFYGALFLVLICWLGDSVFAADTVTNVDSTNVAKKTEESANLFLTAIQGFLQIIGALLGILTQFVALFLNPGWVNGTVFGLDTYLKEIWILVSNVVYFIFAILLIWIAFMNILGKGEKWEMKQALPKFVIGVIIVPFTWFFVQAILAFSGLLTVSVLTLPFDSFGSTMNDKVLKTEICQDYTINLGKKEGDDKEYIKCTSKKGKSISDILQGKGDSIYSIISIYTYGIISIEDIDQITKDMLKEKGGIGVLVNMVVKSGFDLIFVIVYFLLMVALFLALMTRGVWLWIYAMLSPIFGLMFFFDKNGKSDGEGIEKLTVGNFFALAMVPVYVGAALSFGLLFLFVATTGMATNNKNILEDSFMCVDNKNNCISVGGFKLTIEGVFSNSTEKDKKSVNAIFFDNGIGGAMGKFIVEMLGIVILWIAVMAALKSSKITEQVTAPIAQFGKSIGELVAKAPTYAPIIPGGKDGKPMSVHGLAQAGSSINTTMSGAAAKSGTAFGQKVGTKLANSMGYSINKHIQAAELKAAGIDFSKISNPAQRANDFKKILKAYNYGSMQELLDDRPGYQDMVNRMSSTFKLKEDDKNSLLTVTNKAQFDNIFANLTNNPGYKEKGLDSIFGGGGQDSTGSRNFDELYGNSTSKKEAGDMVSTMVGVDQHKNLAGGKDISSSGKVDGTQKIKIASEGKSKAIVSIMDQSGNDVRQFDLNISSGDNNTTYANLDSTDQKEIQKLAGYVNDKDSFNEIMKEMGLDNIKYNDIDSGKKGSTKTLKMNVTPFMSNDGKIDATKLNLVIEGIINDLENAKMSETEFIKQLKDVNILDETQINTIVKTFKSNGENVSSNVLK